MIKIGNLNKAINKKTLHYMKGFMSFSVDSADTISNRLPEKLAKIFSLKEYLITE